MQDYLGKTSVSSYLSIDFTTMRQTPLLGAGEKLAKEKSGCLLIATNDGHLIGIVTSQDFIRLTLSLL